MKALVRLLLFAMALMAVEAHAADVRAWLDRNSMQLGETVTLNVELSGDTHAPQPDFSALQSDFDLLGTQSSTALNIVNGQSSAKLLWAVGLQPKHAGTIVLPALEIGGQRTQALTLTVQPAVAAASGKAGDDLYIETAAEPRAPYVQQQVLYTVKLYFALNFSDGGLDDPQADGVTVHKLGQDAYYSAEVGGRRYRVWERRYALTPEKSGAVTLPAITFHGHAIDPADINSFFTRGRAVTARSLPIPLDVRPRPAASGADTWLPARSLTLTAQGVDSNLPARVGEPLTLTLHLKAQGLGFEQLPDLKLPKIDGADVYPDKTTTQNRDDGAWIYGERERKFAVVPNRPGTLLLPDLSLDWWDTAHDRAEVVRIAAVTLHVEPARAGRVSAPDDRAVADRGSNKFGENVPAMGNMGPAAAAEAVMWRNLALFALVLWLLTLSAWIGWLLLQRRRVEHASPRTATENVSTAAVRAQFLAAVRRDDAAGAARALLAWARTERPSLRNLGELAAILDDPRQALAARALDRACYAQGASNGQVRAQAGAFTDSLRFQNRAKSTSTVLPHLYPSGT